MAMYAGRRVPKSRYRLGDVVLVRGLPEIRGAVTKYEYRSYGDGTGWWAYKVGGKWWNPGSLRKVPVRKKGGRG